MKPIQNVLLRFASEGVVRLCGLVSFPILARSLGADGYGVVIGVGVLAGLASASAGLGLSFHVGRITATRSAEDQLAVLRTLIIITLTAGALACALLIAVSQPLAGVYLGHSDGASAIAAAAFGVVAGACDGILLEWLRARRRFGAISAIQSATALAQLAAIMVVLHAGGGPVSVVGVVSIVQLARMLVTMRLLRNLEVARCGARAGNGRIPLSAALALVVDALPILVATLLSWGSVYASRVVLGTNLDAAALGCFGAAALVASAISMLGSACWLPLYPALVRGVAIRRWRVVYLACRTYGWIFHVIALPTLMIGALLGGQAISLLAGARFSHLGTTCTILLLGSYLEMACLPWSYAVSASGDAWRIRNAVLTGCLVSILASLLLIPAFGIPGAALALLAGQIANATAHAFAMHAIGGDPAKTIPWRSIGVAVAMGASALPASLAAAADGWIGLLSGALAGSAAALVVLASAWKLGMFTKRPLRT